MNPFYIKEHSEEMANLVAELSEAFYDDDGNPIQPGGDFIELGCVVERIKRKCDSILEDIKESYDGKTDI